MKTTRMRAGAAFFAMSLCALVRAQSGDDQLWPNMSGFPLDIISLDSGICAPLAYPARHYPPDTRIRTREGDDALFASLAMLNLREDQQAGIDKLHADLRRRNWELQGRVFDEKDKLRTLFRESVPDPQAVGKLYDAVFALQREIIVNRVDAANKMLALLTPAQRNRLRLLQRQRPASDAPKAGVPYREPAPLPGSGADAGQMGVE